MSVFSDHLIPGERKTLESAGIELRVNGGIRTLVSHSLTTSIIKIFVVDFPLDRSESWDMSKK